MFNFLDLLEIKRSEMYYTVMEELKKNLLSKIAKASKERQVKHKINVHS